MKRQMNKSFFENLSRPKATPKRKVKTMLPLLTTVMMERGTRVIAKFEAPTSIALKTPIPTAMRKLRLAWLGGRLKKADEVLELTRIESHVLRPLHAWLPP
jgi:hypothetical protein